MTSSVRPFKVHSKYKPAGDQPAAIAQLVEGLQDGLSHQTLLGVTGSGKTFTIANVVEQVQRPTLVMAHNKTLAAQLYGEFKEFFPDNAVEYFPVPRSHERGGSHLSVRFVSGRATRRRQTSLCRWPRVSR